MLLEVKDLQAQRSSSQLSAWLPFLTEASKQEWQLSLDAWDFLLEEFSEFEWRFALKSETISAWLLTSAPLEVVEKSLQNFNAEQKEALATAKAPQFIQDMLLDEGKEVLLALSVNQHLSSETGLVLALKLREIWDSFSQREQDLIKSSNSFTWTIELDAQFCYLVNPSFCLQQISAFDADAETVSTLSRDWEGSLRELFQACEVLRR